jgi:glutamine amidotransferase
VASTEDSDDEDFYRFGVATVIVIVDCGIGNTGSIVNMLRRCGNQTCVASSPEIVESASKLILPGVGSFDYGMRRLGALDLVSVLEKKVIHQRTPILGICLGLELFTRCSEEGEERGLGWLDAETVKFRSASKGCEIKVPHMGWNTISRERAADGLPALNGEGRFYFAHSYHVVCDREDDVFATTGYGYTFPSVVRHENILGVQFHPEKSHRFGLAFLRDFAAL